MTNSIARDNYIYDQERAIHISESHNNEIYNNTISNSTSAISLIGNSSSNKVYDNNIANTKKPLRIDAGLEQINTIYSNRIVNDTSPTPPASSSTSLMLPFLISPQTSSESSSSPVPSSLPDNAVTITSPTDGQKVPVGQDLEVTGTSIAKPGSGCKISVNLNRIRPLQPAAATGHSGADDYSQWSATLSSKYASIQEGQNRIAARISCGSDPSLRQFAHVNVTGVPP